MKQLIGVPFCFSWGDSVSRGRAGRSCIARVPTFYWRLVWREFAMKRFACLVIVAALALQCAASGPKVDWTVKRDKPSIDPRQNVFQAPKIVIPPRTLDD